MRLSHDCIVELIAIIVANQAHLSSVPLVYADHVFAPRGIALCVFMPGILLYDWRIIVWQDIFQLASTNRDRKLIDELEPYRKILGC